MFIYLSLPFLLFALWNFRTRIETWMIFVFCNLFLLVYAFAIPNMGALHRLRYSYLMTLMTVGLAVMPLALAKLKEKVTIDVLEKSPLPN